MTKIAVNNKAHIVFATASTTAKAEYIWADVDTSKSTIPYWLQNSSGYFDIKNNKGHYLFTTQLQSTTIAGNNVNFHIAFSNGETLALTKKSGTGMLAIFWNEWTVAYDSSAANIFRLVGGSPISKYNAYPPVFFEIERL